MRGIRGQLIWMMVRVVLATLVSIVAVTLLVARHQMFEVGGREAMLRAQAFAFRAGFATLVAREDPLSAQELLREITTARETTGAELVDESSKPLAKREGIIGSLLACDFASHEKSAADQVVLYAIAGTWCVSAPVRKRKTTLNREEGATGEIIGRLRIASSQRVVERVVARLIAWSLLAGMAVLAGGVFLVVRGSRRVTDPLLGIVTTMQAAGQANDRPRAPLVGPEEIVTISKVYNALMEDIERQAAQLEAKVEQRTQELRVATETARDAVKYKSAFMAAVSHEMKTPLHVIEANTRDVISELEFIDGAEQIRGNLAVILSQSGELAMRLSQILDLSRADAGSYEMVREEFELGAFAQDLREKAAPLAKKNRNAVEVHTAGDRAYTDRDMLLLVATNLVVNACKFTEAGRVRVNIRRLAGALELEVIDNGRGISAEQQKVIWEEFRQGDMGEGRRFGGFGLGLSIVKRFCQMLGGTVNLESELGRGTRVVVRVPAVATESD